MEPSYIVLSFVRLGLLLLSFFSIPPSILMIKAAWQANDKKKMRKGISLLWGGVLAGCIFVKMFGYNVF